MMDVSEEEYETKHGSTMFGFIMGGRRYLRRNIAVALGTAGDKKAFSCQTFQLIRQGTMMVCSILFFL